MAINDDAIDLTLDRKFRVQQRSILSGPSAMDKLFGGHRLRTSGKVPLSELFGIPRHTHLPWNSKPITGLNDLNSKRIKRSNGDVLSDDFGETIRVTENNSVMVLSNKFNNKDYLIEEFFLENTGFIPYSNINICYSCGRRQISPYKNFWGFRTCPQCSSPRIPWTYARRRGNV